MNLFSLFRNRGTAPVARDRLQILLAHERTIAGGSDLVAILREEILAVIKKHISVDSEKVLVKMDRGDAVSTLEVDIEIPTQTILAKPAEPAGAVKPAEKPAEKAPEKPVEAGEAKKAETQAAESKAA